MTTPERLAVTSRDGVSISVEKSGSGPALLLVHGSMVDGATSWAAVLPALREHFTTYVMDRRGRAGSGDAPDYSLAAEVSDLIAVVDTIGESLKLLAHSYGGVVTVAALDRLQRVSQLILYEPPIFERRREGKAEAIRERMEEALRAGDREQIVTIFLREQIGAPPEALAGMKASPLWPSALAAAHTLPREIQVVNTLRVPAEKLKQCTIPTAMLVGTTSSADLQESLQWVSGLIPSCRVVALEGQGHAAMMSAPDLFVSKLLQVTGGAANAASSTSLTY